MRFSPLALAGALLLRPALAAAQQPPRAPTAMPAPPPPGPYPLALRTKTHSPALIGGGIALLALGGLSIAGAATVILVDTTSGSGDNFRGVFSLVAGLPLLIHGAGCIGGGIPMIVIGARQVPVMPSITVGPTTTLRWAF